ncbi:hypothetical protein AGABI1DRAFT_126794 [Agaricus bisporus var. burnettii JB137-S8]|uniref:Uncharacterized protein n=1 Tax=Agaricus bisporus var. burnettii (strain JB137-S8 / ATCC MYA-4627 / FGSC 10392) TaxID=597362 RepID=K5XCC1_AGABU|nr:uncharacterized protein AGABI1DRAFT_126794 [Agaricus bisporus var. burnettii JB137-S8]EKM80747.1 hypothetical protein AGABI1DRAFT_126794 [Agaricus bisporus var. burnettii JB137-S8]
MTEPVLALILATTEFKGKSSPTVYMLLQVFVIGGSVIHIVYTTGLVIVALITVFAFDKDVWIRDIDSSPSPFPVPILIEYLRLRPSTWQRGEGNPNQPYVCQIHSILPCDCPAKPPPREDAGAGENPQKTKSLPHLLVRVPDAAQQRTSISISFEAVR